jgi:hypothetical protein
MDLPTSRRADHDRGDVGVTVSRNNVERRVEPTQLDQGMIVRPCGRFAYRLYAVSQLTATRAECLEVFFLVVGECDIPQPNNDRIAGG